MRWWKVLGLAGLAGVAASGVVIARGQRERRSYTPEEIRSRLHERVSAVGSAHGEAEGPGVPEGAAPRP